MGAAGINDSAAAYDSWVGQGATSVIGGSRGSGTNTNNTATNGSVNGGSGGDGRYGGGGGGGGYYGGGGGAASDSILMCGAGGGGSGYVHNSVAVNEGGTYRADETGYVNNPITTGEGFIRITKLAPTDYTFTGSRQTISMQPGTYVVEL